MQSDEVLRPLHALGEARNGQSRRVRAEQCVIGDDLLDPAEGLVLEGLVLEHCLNHQIRALGQVE